ncbi:hypothetical protein Fcan01_09217 [Folsomia candida]|uniref:Gustatory receptor n=1 Tax=Folsomia candida TaxID=158441 RepID=A0A226ED02_FOLCA|nr:hypothetical protein Fcan01_09217 [Folsomia candida]
MMYYVFESPYKIVVNTDGEFTTYSSTPRKIMCAILHTIGLFIYCNEVRKSNLSRTTTNPVDYLNAFLKTTSCIHHIIFVQTVWSRKAQFLKLVQHLASMTRNDTFRAVNNGNKFPLSTAPPKWVIILLTYLFPAIAIISTICLHGLPLKDDTLVKVFVELRGSFFEKRCNLERITEEERQHEHDIEYASTPVILISYFLLFSRILLSFVTDALISMVILSFYCAVSNLMVELRSESTKLMITVDMFSELRNEYENLTRLCDLVNSSISRLMLTYLMETVFFYSVYLKELAVLDGRCISVQLWIGFLFGTFCAVFYLAAETSSQMDQAKIILTNFDVGGIDQVELVNVRLKLQSKTFAISGNGIFQLNYSLVSAVRVQHHIDVFHYQCPVSSPWLTLLMSHSIWEAIHQFPLSCSSSQFRDDSI